MRYRHNTEDRRAFQSGHRSIAKTTRRLRVPEEAHSARRGIYALVQQISSPSTFGNDEARRIFCENENSPKMLWLCFR